MARVVRRPKSRIAVRIVRHALLIVFLVAMLYPLLWMVAASFRPNNEIFQSLGSCSSHYTIDNYIAGWTGTVR